MKTNNNSSRAVKSFDDMNQAARADGWQLGYKPTANPDMRESMLYGRMSADECSYWLAGYSDAQIQFESDMAE